MHMQKCYLQFEHVYNAGRERAPQQRLPKASCRLISLMHDGGKSLPGANHLAWPRVPVQNLVSSAELAARNGSDLQVQKDQPFPGRNWAKAHLACAEGRNALPLLLHIMVN